MHKYKLLLIGSALCCAAVLLAQTLPSLITDFRVSRFERGPGWYYAITLKPEIERITLTPAIKLVNEPPQSYTLLVDFSGKPGKAGGLATHKVQQ